MKDPSILDLLGEHFIIDPLTLGESPKESLESKVQQYQAEHPYTPVPESWLPQYHLERYLAENFVIGSYHDEAHWNWITKISSQRAQIYNIRLDAKRDGAQKLSELKRMNVKFAILYEQGHENENRFHVFRVHDTMVMNEERMKAAYYPRTPKGSYFIFCLDEEINLGNFDIKHLIGQHRLSTSDYKEGTPIFVKGEELIKYRKA